MRRSPWDFWAPILLLGIGIYRLTTGDLLLSVFSLSLGVVAIIAGGIPRRRG